MKDKYQRMTKEEKKEARKQYKQASEFNKSQCARLTRAKVTGILGIVYGIVMIIYSLIIKGFWWEYMAYCFVLVFGIGLYIKSNDFYGYLINKYLIEEAKKTNKKASKGK